jgi:hypothetical protein
MIRQGSGIDTGLGWIPIIIIGYENRDNMTSCLLVNRSQRMLRCYIILLTEHMIAAAMLDNHGMAGIQGAVTHDMVAQGNTGAAANFRA